MRTLVHSISEIPENKMDSAISHFWSKVTKTDSCWLWNAAKNQFGYGLFVVSLTHENGIHFSAHRFSYELTNGIISEGLTLDHLCRNTSCVNPLHLETVSMKENIFRGNGLGVKLARRTHCKRGHPLVEGNLVNWRQKPQYRRCLTCYRIQHRFNQLKEYQRRKQIATISAIHSALQEGDEK